MAAKVRRVVRTGASPYIYISSQLRSEKTDRGQRKPGTFVVHPQWLWDSVAHWKRVPEEPYVETLKVLDAAEMRASTSAPNSNAASPSPTPSSPLAESTTPMHSKRIDSTSTGVEAVPIIDLTTESFRRASGREGPPPEEYEPLPPAGSLVGQSVDWAAIDEEVDAFLNETDDDDDMEDGDMDDGASDGSVRSSRSK